MLVIFLLGSLLILELLQNRQINFSSSLWFRSQSHKVKTLLAACFPFHIDTLPGQTDEMTDTP